MARLRSSARKASRFTGEQFGSGFQYRTPEPFRMEFGPWDTILDNAAYNAPPNVLSGIDSSKLLNGAVYPLYAVAGTGSTIVGGKTYEVITAFVFTIGGVEYEIGIMFNATDSCVAIYNNGAYTSFAAVAMVSAGFYNNAPRAWAVQWGKYIYFGSANFNGFYKYDPVANTITAVVGFANPMYDVFVLNNNMCVAEYTAADQSYTLSWSVDGSPEDFTGAGSGSTIFFKPYLRTVVYNESGYIFFTIGAVRMDPTGTLPAFKFSDIAGISGARSPLGIELAGDKLAYVAVDGNLKVFDGSEQDVQKRVGLNTLRSTGITGTPICVIYVPTMKWLLVGEATTNFYVFDENLKRQHNVLGSYISILAKASGPIVGWNRTGHTRDTYTLFDFVGGSSHVEGSLGIPTLDFGKNVFIDYLEVYCGNATSAGQISVTLVYSSDTVDSNATQSTSLANASGFYNTIGRMKRFKVHRSMRLLSITVLTGGIGAIIYRVAVLGHKERVNDGS